MTKLWTRLSPYILGFILTLVGLAYISTLTNQFVWDDYHFILGWPELANFPASLDQLISGQMPLGAGFTYRPLRSLLYATAFQLFGTNPIGYQLLGIIVHIFSTFFVFKIASHLTKSRPTALLAATIFGLHPLNVEAIAWITASFDTVGNLFFLISLYLYLKSSTISNQRSTISLAFALAAFLTNELTLTLPLIILLYELTNIGKNFGVTRLGGPPRRGPLRVFLGENRGRTRKFLATSFNKSKPYFLVFSAYWFLRLVLMTSPTSPSIGFLFNSRILNTLILLKALLLYPLLFLFPWPLTTNHTLHQGITSFAHADHSGLAPNILDPLLLLPALFPILLIIFLITLLVINIKRSMINDLRSKIHPLRSIYPEQSRGTLYPLIAGFLALLPTLQLFPNETLFAERYSYLANVFFAIAFASLIATLYKHFSTKTKPPYPTIALAIFIHTLVGILLILTISQNQVWKTPQTLWTHALKHTPNSNKINSNLGVAYFRDNQPELGLKYLQLAYDYNPNDTTTRYKLANALVETGSPELALPHFDFLLSQTNDKISALQDITRILNESGYPDLAQQYSQTHLTN